MSVEGKENSYLNSGLVESCLHPGQLQGQADFLGGGGGVAKAHRLRM